MDLLKRLEPGSAETRKTVFYAFGLALVLLLADQLTKAVIAASFKVGERHPVIPGIFDLFHITNPGAAWGILSGKGWLLLTISILVLAGVLYYLHEIADGWRERYFALLLVASGIVGNSIDRVFRGEVVDFLFFHYKKFSWPAFNVADMCICVGVFLFILSSILRPEKKKTKDSDEQKDDSAAIS